MPIDQIDVSGQLKGQVSVKPEEHPEERIVRLRAEQRGALIEDCKGVVTFAVLLTAIVAIGCLCAYEALLDASASPDTKRWSQTVLSALLASAVSFVVGRKVGSKS